MKKYYIRVTTNHGMGTKYVSKPTELAEGDYEKLIEILQSVSQMSFFKMQGRDGQTIVFPDKVCETSVFELVPAE